MRHLKVSQIKEFIKELKEDKPETESCHLMAYHIVGCDICFKKYTDLKKEDKNG